MRRRYVRPEARFQGSGTIIYIPAPTKGLNTRDAYQDLYPNEARLLENLDPEGNGITFRPGYAVGSTSAGTTAVSTVHVWRGATAVVVGTGDGKVYDVTDSAASELATGYTENYWQAQYFNGWSFFVNGTDTPFRFDGTSTAATGFTGPTSLADLVNVTAVKNRLWFCENDTADVWYGGAAAVTGGLTKFQLSQIAQGGTCMAIGAWSTDGGDGPDDYNVFVMSTGEVLIYSGDPATTFEIAGRYQAPPPIGRRCLVNYGGALAVLTQSGLIPLNYIQAGVAFDPKELGDIGKVSSSIFDDFDSFGSNDGWDATFAAGKIYVNVPISSVLSKQYVYNTHNGTWTTYVGLPVASITEYDNGLYFGGLSGGKAWSLSGTTDNGGTITGKLKGAFVEPFALQGKQSGGKAASFSALRHRFTSLGALSGRFGLDIDYIDRDLSRAVYDFITVTSTTAWGSDWGSAWGTAKQSSAPWFSADGHGLSVGVNLEIYSSDKDAFFHGTDVEMIPANFL